MKVTCVSIMVTIPAPSAASMAETEVKGVAVPLRTTLAAKFQVIEPPENNVPETARAVHELLPEVKLVLFPRQTTRNTCHRAENPPWFWGGTSTVWS